MFEEKRKGAYWCNHLQLLAGETTTQIPINSSVVAKFISTGVINYIFYFHSLAPDDIRVVSIYQICKGKPFLNRHKKQS